MFEVHTFLFEVIHCTLLLILSIVTATTHSGIKGYWTFSGERAWGVLEIYVRTVPQYHTYEKLPIGEFLRFGVVIDGQLNLRSYSATLGLSPTLISIRK